MNDLSELENPKAGQVESFSIKPCENGFVIENCLYGKEMYMWDYKKYVFNDWNGVLQHITANPINI